MSVLSGRTTQSSPSMIRGSSMVAYMSCIVEPLLRALRPRNIVEIGSYQGEMTRLLLNFCTQHNAVLHSIDPAPQIDLAEWQKADRLHFRFYKGKSLAALLSIDSYDAVLIDGDHNWYTVFHELDLIEKAVVQRSRLFPLVLLHDVGWPYGRRDSYHDPESIPQAYLHPHARRGMRIDREELQDDLGLNALLCNALESNTSRNGVLTACKDFLDRSSLSLDCLVIPGFHGLGVLVPTETVAQNGGVRRVLEAWRWAPEVSAYVERVENARVFFEIALRDEQSLRRRDQERFDQERRAIWKQVAADRGGSRTRIDELSRQVGELTEETADLRRKLSRLANERQAAESQRQEALQARDRLQEQHESLQEAVRQLRAEQDVAAAELRSARHREAMVLAQNASIVESPGWRVISGYRAWLYRNIWPRPWLRSCYEQVTQRFLRWFLRVAVAFVLLLPAASKAGSPQNHRAPSDDAPDTLTALGYAPPGFVKDQA